MAGFDGETDLLPNTVFATALSGVYTPTWFAGTNTTIGSTVVPAQWMQVGSHVLVTGAQNIVLGSTVGISHCEASLPINTTLANDYDIGGCGLYDNRAQGIGVYFNAAGSQNRVHFATDSTGAGSVNIYYAYMYALNIASSAQSGIYTPTWTPVTNVSASMPAINPAKWIRAGNIVIVAGMQGYTITTSGQTYIDCSVPISTTTSAFEHMSGMGTFKDKRPGVGAYFYTPGAQNKIRFALTANTGMGTPSMGFLIVYRVLP